MKLLDYAAKTLSENGTWKHPTIYDFVLTHGRQYTPQPKPDEFKWMRTRDCFGNAWTLAERHTELTYVEGFAISGMRMPMHHAWVVDAEGGVIDTTWREPGTEYFGVPFPLIFVAKMIGTSGQTGIIDNAVDDWSLLRNGYSPPDDAVSAEKKHRAKT